MRNEKMESFFTMNRCHEASGLMLSLEICEALNFTQSCI